MMRSNNLTGDMQPSVHVKPPHYHTSTPAIYQRQYKKTQDINLNFAINLTYLDMAIALQILPLECGHFPFVCAFSKKEMRISYGADMMTGSKHKLGIFHIQSTRKIYEILIPQTVSMFVRHKWRF